MYMYVCMYVNIYYILLVLIVNTFFKGKNHVLKSNFVRCYAFQSVFYLLFILILIYNIYVVFLSLVLARATFLYYVF